MKGYVVVGGGLAGLTAANALACGGRCKVTLLEQTDHLGGRAITRQDRGYLLNLGAHALHRNGKAARTLRGWSVPIYGKPPDTTSSSFLVRNDQMHPLIFTVGKLLTTCLFNGGEKLQAARVLKQLSSGPATERESIKEWIEQRATSTRVREFVAMLIRVSTYSADLSLLSARPALQQFRSATKDGVLYLDGGWQTMVDGLEQRARQLGVEIRKGEPVETIRAIESDGIVLALPPAAVERITGRRLPTMHPVRVACLDLGLRTLPRYAARVALSIDQPLYLSVHSTVAKLAPEGAAVVHACKYLGGRADPASDRRELEQFVDLAIPDWHEHAEVVRFLPDMTVTPAVSSPQSRPAIDELGIPGVLLAGDWVAGEGMLADAAVASGLQSAAHLLQRQKLGAA
jgi:glycine/D-amino acid oxidase-like deaminating enzyme